MSKKLSDNIKAEMLAKASAGASNRELSAWLLAAHGVSISHQAVGNLRKRQAAKGTPKPVGNVAEPVAANLPARRKTGRKTLCTPDLTERIAKELRHGGTYAMAARLSGISAQAFGEWMRRGEDGEEPFASFREAITRAHEAFKRKALREIRKGVLPSGMPDWKAYAWIITHHPLTRDEFAEQTQVTVKVERALEEKLSHLEKTLSPNEYERVLCALAGEVGGEAPRGATH